MRRSVTMVMDATKEPINKYLKNLQPSPYHCLNKSYPSHSILFCISILRKCIHISNVGLYIRQLHCPYTLAHGRKIKVLCILLNIIGMPYLDSNIQT